jgi:hypothetical protein
LYGGADLQQPATFWKRELFDKAGELDSSLQAAFDTDLFFRFISINARFRYTNAFLANFRVHPDQISGLRFAEAQKELNVLRSRYLSYPINSVTGRLLRNIGRLQRAIWYFRQGDLLWLIGRIPDRMKSRARIEATGPRSRWV